MEPWVPGLLAGSAAILVALVGGWLQSRRETKARSHATHTPSPPSTQEVWQRLDHVERVVRSAVYVLGEVAEQWEGESPPVLSRKHVAVLDVEGYLPPEWEPLTSE
jgi:hypothetical protein